MRDLVALNLQDLMAGLARLDVPVPPRGLGRTKTHTEVYALVRLLAALGASELAFPLSFTKQERPDFLLRTAIGWVGIEHVEAIAPNAASEVALRNRKGGYNLHFPYPHRVGDSQKTSAELRQIIAANNPGYPWMGKSVEMAWAEDMALVIKNKVKIAGKSGFNHFDSNWLLIYDNLTAPALEHDVALPKLVTHLADQPPWSMFDRIFIVNDSKLVRVAQYGSFSISRLPTILGK